jgi:hypothetical protein
MANAEYPVTKEEAIRAVTEASWAKQVEQCGHTGCQDHLDDGPERYIHVFSRIGSDITLDWAIELISEAEHVAWRWHILQHELYVLTQDHRIYQFEVRAPFPLKFPNNHDEYDEVGQP